MIDRLGNVIAELRERRAIRFLVGYLVGAWITAQIAGFFVEQGYIGRRVLDVTLFLAVAFFFLTVVLVWYHGEKGQQKVQRLEGLMIGALLLIGAGGSAWIATREATRGTTLSRATYDLGDNSVAVLPFENSISAPQFEWLDRGIPDLIATDLSQFDTLRVVSGQRLFDLLRQLGVENSRTVPRDLQEEVTRGAGARYMLTGSVVGSAENMQLLATLSDTDSGEIRASARARGSDIFSLVDEVSAALSLELVGSQLAAADAPVAELTTTSIEAFQEFDAGRTALWQFQVTQARTHFERAIELDSTFAAAYFQLAGLQVRLGDMGNATSNLQAANRHLTNASERDRLYVGGFIDMIYGQLEEGERKFRELLAKYPYEKDARIIFSGFLQRQGRNDEVERLTEETVQLDPFYGNGWNQLAYRYANRGDFVGADTLIQKYIDLEPTEPNPWDSRGEILEMAGRRDEAREQYRKALALREDFAVGLGHLARSYRREGRYADAREVVSEYKASESADTRVWAWWIAADTRAFEGDVAGALATYDTLVSVAASTERPDLHGMVLDGLIRTMIHLERYGDAVRYADSLEALRGRDPITAVARLHYLSSEGRFDEVDQVRAAIVDPQRQPGIPAVFVRIVEATTQAVIEFHRGRHERVVELFNEVRPEATFPLVQFGFPAIRSALEIGDAESAIPGVRAIPAMTLGPEYHTSPFLLAYQDYFEGRIAELQSDTTRAVEEYAGLIDRWGDGLNAVPSFRDIRARRDALTSP